MAYSAKVGSFNIDTTKVATETQSITGVGFQPKIVLFFWGGSTASSDTVAGGTYNIGFGAAISSTSRFSNVSISEDAQADSDVYTYMSQSEVIRCYTDTSTVDGLMDFSSMDAGGFTLIVDDQFTQAYRISYLALGGDDLTNVYLSYAEYPIATGNYDITSVGFEPDALITCGFGLGWYEAGANRVSFHLGMATGSSNQGVVNTFAYDAQATSYTRGYGYNAEINAQYGLTLRDTFVSFLANGFRLNNLENGGLEDRYFNYICLKGGQYSVGDLTTRTDGNDIEENVGFEPVAVLFGSTNRTLSTQDTSTNHARLSIGAGTSTSNRACAAVSDETGLDDTETAYANYDSAVYAHVIDDAIEALMDIKSIDSDGFTCVMDDTETASCWVTYLAIGATGAAAPAISVSESATIDDSATVAMAALARAAAETLGLSDSAVVSVAEAVALAISESETLGIADAATAAIGDLVANVAEGLGLADAAAAAMGTLGISAGETLTLSAEASLTVLEAGTLALNVGDNLTMVDSLEASMLILMIVAEALTAGDQATVSMEEAPPDLGIAVTAEDHAYWIYSPVVLG